MTQLINLVLKAGGSVQKNIPQDVDFDSLDNEEIGDLVRLFVASYVMS